MDCPEKYQGRTDHHHGHRQVIPLFILFIHQPPHINIIRKEKEKDQHQRQIHKAYQKIRNGKISGHGKHSDHITSQKAVQHALPERLEQDIAVYLFSGVGACKKIVGVCVVYQCLSLIKHYCKGKNSSHADPDQNGGIGVYRSLSRRII